MEIYLSIKKDISCMCSDKSTIKWDSIIFFDFKLNNLVNVCFNNKFLNLHILSALNSILVGIYSFMKLQHLSYLLHITCIKVEGRMTLEHVILSGSMIFDRLYYFSVSRGILKVSWQLYVVWVFYFKISFS